MKIVMKNVNELIPYENNPRINDVSVDKVANSIKEFGFKVPIVIDTEDVIVCGHTRLKAAKKLKMDEVPCVIADDLSEQQIKAFRLADNKVGEESQWDFEQLDFELDQIDDIDMGDFGFEIDVNEFDLSGDENNYEQMKKEFKQRMEDGELSEDSEEYQEFLKKFEQKKTTDDCYTPELVYDTVANYVSKTYKLDKNNFVRPFVPNGDYQAYKYKPTDIVVDNPPFSILTEIINFYAEKNIKFFMFAPHLVLFSSYKNCQYILCGVGITYENGAVVSTSFVTNLEEKYYIKSDSKLYADIKQANDKWLKEIKKEYPKYNYPKYVVTSSFFSGLAKYGIDFNLKKEECHFIRQLESQKESKRAIYGSGYLISERKKAEREKAEREKAEREKAEREKAYVFELSEEEKKIIRELK